MSNERYNEYYTEVLKNTLNSQVTQNLSMQAMALVNKETIQDLQKQVEELKSTQNSKDSDTKKDDKINSLKNIVSELTNKIKELETKLTEQKPVEKDPVKKAKFVKQEPPTEALRDGGDF
jgi:signal transduction histidine kinase